MLIQEPKLTQPEDKTVIWRYMDFASFCCFLTKRALFFKRLDKYSDNFEGTLHESTKKELYEYRMQFDFTKEEESKNWVKNEIANIESFKAHTLSNSWTIEKDENYSMWKIYLKGYNEGVAIKTTVGQLHKCLHENQFNIYAGKVTYEPLKRTDLNLFSVSTNKRSPYKYENEYRVFMPLQFNYDKERRNRIPKYETGVDIPIILRNLVNEIYISPFASEWFDELVFSVTKNYMKFFEKSKIIKSYIKDK